MSRGPGPAPTIRSMRSTDAVPISRVVAKRSPARAVLVALRPRQWTKNLFLGAGIVFAAELDDPERWVRALAAFAVYCAASSAAYLLNDVRDLDDDRRHPIKRLRPIARGELLPRRALLLAAILVAGALVGAALLGVVSLLFLAAFLTLQISYTLALKRLPLLDVGAIALLFVIRAAAGAAAVDVRISPWLLVCTALLALYLGVAKRRGELVLVGSARIPGRAVLRRYSVALLDRLLVVLAGAAVAVYAAYTATAHSRAMVVTVPFVLFGVLRYLDLVRRADLGEEPEEVILGDPPILAAVALWVTVSAVVLATGG